ncbi:MAG TPA: inorganic phosphate transporter, partial [Candidatus Thermoplasmatota archaeon]|nr:inorganic phosphate transporter [Candidatus Thermoplasmatota archaeon]
WLSLAPLVLLTVAVALLFDFYNGINDAANAIATVVATRALPPWAAVLMAAAFNFLGAFIGTAVASAVGKGIVNTDVVDTSVILAALLGGLAWTAFATALGIPISVSHSLIGGLIGAGLATAGWDGLAEVPPGSMDTTWLHMAWGALGGALLLGSTALVRRKNPLWPTVGGAILGSGLWLVVGIATGNVGSMPKLPATLLFIVYSPIMGFSIAYVSYTLIARLAYRLPPGPVKHVFRYLQVGSASFYALGHGTNDAQKTMGVITALLVANGVLATFEVPWDVILMAGTAIGLGTLIGGYKVVRTMGSRLTHLDTSQGFTAESSSALSLFFLANNGVPVSTTHSITGSIMGVGAVQRVSAVSWGTARRIVAAWIITIPASAVVAALAYWTLGMLL